MYRLLIGTAGLLAFLGSFVPGDAEAGVPPASPRHLQAKAVPVPQCEKCRSNAEVVPVIYGKPGPGLVERANRREVALGGCVMRGDRWHCKRCQHRFK
jgi:hypothetical protein